MNLHFSFKAVKTSDLEKEIQQHVNKLDRRLQVFRPDLVHLHGALESGPRESFVVRLNLRLPSGQFSAQDSGASASSAIKTAFSDLLGQLARHKELLRSEHKWRRQKFDRVEQGGIDVIEDAVRSVIADHEQRPRESTNGKSTAQEITTASFEESNRPSVQADVRTYINANLPRLERYVRRELLHLQNSGNIRDGEITPEEVIDEVVVTALSVDEKPSKLPLERWLYRLAIQAIRRISSDNNEPPSLHLEDPVRNQNVTASDEPFLQYHQPDEALHREDVVADRRTSNPEEIFGSEELVGEVELALRGTSKDAREAFVLYAVEGFTVEEIAEVTERKPIVVRELISHAREHLKKKLPGSHSLKERLLQHSDIA